MGKTSKATTKQSPNKGEMAGARGLKNIDKWIADEQIVHETAEYGQNKKSVTDAVTDQEGRDQLVKDYQTEVTRAARIAQRDEADKLLSAYGGLSNVSSKRLGCLRDISQIAGLEDFLGTLSTEFAQRATDLVANETAKKSEVPDREAEGVARTAQNCILAVRQNWSWISKLVKCVDIHLQHTSDYHQFFHEVKEYEQWMPIELKKAQDKVAYRESSTGDTRETEQILLELKEVLTVFLHWQGKVDKLFDKSRHIIPVHLRTTKLGYIRPVSALCDYKTKEINIREGEELQLTDNGKPQSWVVKNMHYTEATVPSVILVIPGPDPDAVNLATRLRLQLLGVWTLNVKRIGKTLIYTMLLILKQWNDPQARKLAAASAGEKGEMQRVLRYIESVLGPYWTGYDGYKMLQDRVKGTESALSRRGNPEDRDDDATAKLMEQFGVIENLLKVFKDLWSQWETFRMMVETSKHSDYMLMLQNWEQLKFVDAATLRDLWQRSLDFSSEDQSEWLKMVQALLKMQGADMTDGGEGSFGYGESTRKTQYEKELNMSEMNEMGSSGYGESVSHETVTATEMASLGQVSNGFGVALDSSVTTLERQTETAETEQISHAEQEEKKTFVITGVMDPRSDEEVSMHQAVMLGIIDSQAGTYNNPDTGESMPIPVAMNAGKIKVEFTKTRKSAEKRHDVGLITIKTERESRPYTVKGVLDAKTDKELSVDEAVAKKILNQTNGTYYNTLTETEMTLADALDSALLIVEFDKEVEVAEPEVVTRTYAIHSVVDQRRKERVSFADAVRLGLLDKETGAYFNNASREHLYVGDAIKKGFIKATVVKDPSKLNIDPQNKMVFEKVERIRKKLLNPLAAVASLKKAAHNEEEGK